MAKFALDLNKFKKVKSDVNSTTLKHPDGHSIIISHKALSPKMRGDIHALPMDDGGKVPEKNNAVIAVQKAYGMTTAGPDAALAQDPTTQPSPDAPKQESAPTETPRLTDKEDASLTALGNDPSRILGGCDDKSLQGPGCAKGGMIKQSNPKLEESKKQPPAAKFAEGGTPDVDAALGERPPVSAEGLPDAAPQVSAPIAQDLSPKGSAPSELFGLFDSEPKSPLEEQTEALAQQNAKQEAAAKTQADGITIAKNQIDAYNAQAMKAGLPPKPYTPEMQKLQAVQDMQHPPSSQGQSPQQQGPNDPYGTEAYYGAFQKGLGEQKQGITNEASALGAQGVAESKALQQNIENRQQAAKSYQDHYSELDKERQSFVDDIQKQHIDPRHYLNSMGTGQRIATGIGLILGGMGGGLMHQANPAQQFLQAQIDNDINAQKANLGKSENLLAANMRQFGNLRDATDMTRIMQSDIVSSQLKQAAANSMDPLAKARALQAAGKLDMDSAPVLSQMAMRRTLLGGMQNGQIAPEQVVRAIVPANEQAAAYKELQVAQNVSKAKDNILSAFDQVSKLNTVGNRVMNPMQAKRQVEAITEPLTAGLSKETAGRFTEQDAGMLKSLWPSPGDSEQTINTKRQQINRLVSEKMHFPMLQAYGINMGNQGQYSPTGQNKLQFTPR